MKLRVGLSVAVITSALTLATTPASFFGERLLLDRVASAAERSQATSAKALEVLEQVALGRTRDISAQTQTELGMIKDELQKNEFNDPFVRAYAFHKLAETGLTEAVDFLTNLRREDIGPDNSQQIWPAAQVALQTALLKRTRDPQHQIEFLQRTLTSQLPDGRGAVAWWAVNELCDRGDLPSTAMIQEVIKAKWSDRYGDDQLRFCEARMHVISRDPDRVKALGSVLTVTNTEDDDQLIAWAISQLRTMGSPKAKDELRRFTSEITALPRGSLQQQRFDHFKQEVASALEGPDKK